MPIDILPESRPRDRKGAVQTKDGWLIPIYCANCSKKWGMVPEKNITFAFALCDPCSETHGHPAHFYAEPDAVFWRRVAEEAQDMRLLSLSQQELQKHFEDQSSAIGKLLREHYNATLKET